MRMDVVTNAQAIGDNGKITIGSFLDFGVLAGCLAVGAADWRISQKVSSRRNLHLYFSQGSFTHTRLEIGGWGLRYKVIGMFYIL